PPSPPTASAHSGSASGTPAPITTPDITPGAVTVLSYTIITNANQLRNSTQAAVALTGLSHQHTVTGTNGLLVMVNARWLIQNASGARNSCGVLANLKRDGSVIIASAEHAW